MNDKELLGLKIRTIRKSKKITQEMLSEKVDISPRQIVKIEMGQAYPSLETLKNIAEALEVPIQSLFENDYYESSEILKEKIKRKVEGLDEKTTRFVYLVVSNLD